MDLSFAAAPEAADGDWGEDETVEALGDKQLARCSRSRSRSPNIAPKDNLAPPKLALTNGAGLSPPKSKIHNNPRTRYFVMKSNNHKNLVLSVENDVWATQRHNEEKLNEALHTAPHVVLIFSVNTSGCFQGYAKMAGKVGASRKTDVFKGYGRAFDIRWLRLKDLEFSEVSHIQNPWNENQSVKISRDGQELPNEVGARLCEMADLRVFHGDPAGYVTDEREVETGGFEPLPTPVRSSVQPILAPGVGQASHVGGSLAPGYGAPPPHHGAHPHSSAPPHFAASAPPPPGGQPPLPPWGLPPSPWAAPQMGHGAWSYPPWGPGFDCSSYYSDSSSSSSSSEDEAVPPQPPGVALQAPATAPAPSPLPQEAPAVVAPVVSEAPPAASETAPPRSSKESSKKAKKEKAVITEKSKEKKSKKEKSKKDAKEPGKVRSSEHKRKSAAAEVGQAATTNGDGVSRRDRERHRRGEKKGDASKSCRRSRDRARRREDTSKAPAEANGTSQWRVGVGALAGGHPAHGAPQPHAFGAPPGFGHPPQQPHPSGANWLPPLGHAPPPRPPPTEWHGACPTRR